MWSMGKIFRGAEVTRIYVGSYHDEEIKNKEQFGPLFEKDYKSLLSQLKELPRMCCMRKVNEMVKRIRLCVVHTCVLGNLRAKMPMFYGGEAVRAKLIKDLHVVFEEVRTQYHLSEGDFPDIDEFRGVLQRMDFYSFPAVNRSDLNQLQEMLSNDVPRIISHISGVVAEGPGMSHHRSQDGTKTAKGPNVFSLEDEDEKAKQSQQRMAHTQQLMAGVIAVLVVVVSIILASVMDNHQTIKHLTAKLTEQVQKL